MEEIDIEVKQGILETYHNYPYKSPQVFGEFIDNSIQSFEDNKNVLTTDQNYVLRVNIDIEWEEGDDHIVRAKTIIIEDNSAGMTIDKFKEAFKSADHSTIRMGMNEFGMGMKVAACWLGAKWRVETKSIAEDIVHSLEIDVKKVSRENIKKLPSRDFVDSNRTHGTRIIISDMWPQTQIKKDNLEDLTKGIASIYRYFLRRKEVQIYICDQALCFDTYPVLEAPSYLNPQGPTIKWNCPVTMQFQKYTITGFVALLPSMDDDKRGVVIMRNHRVVMGFAPEDRTVGKMFSGQAGSAKYRRVYGELEISGFEVAFGKNQIIDIDQLESLLEMVAGKLKLNGTNLLTQCMKYKKPKKDNPTPPVVPPVVPPVTPPTPPTIPPSTPVTPVTPPSTPVTPPATPVAPSDPSLLSTGKFKFGGNDFSIQVKSGNESSELFWNDLSKIGEKTLICKVNTTHPFFSVYGQPTKQVLAMVKALSIAKYKATVDSNNSASAMMNEFNSIINNQEA